MLSARNQNERVVHYPKPQFNLSWLTTFASNSDNVATFNFSECCKPRHERNQPGR